MKAAADQAEIEAFARRIAPHLRGGDVILLSGPLGAGKSTLARALLRAACGAPELDVPSPSFSLVQSYTALGGLVLHHFDLWRLDGPEGLAELGWDEARDGVVIVEWPDRLGLVQPGALRVELAVAGPDTRTLSWTGWDDRAQLA